VQWTDVATHLTGQAHIATVRADGSPHVAKVWPALDGQTIWIGTRATSGKARNLRVNPEAALMFEPAGEAYVSGDVEVIAALVLISLSLAGTLLLITDLLFPVGFAIVAAVVTFVVLSLLWWAFPVARRLRGR